MFLFTIPAEAVDSKKQSIIFDKYIFEIAQGNKEALADLYEDTRAMVYGYALSICKDPHNAEDILQDVFVQIWNAAAQYSSTGKPMAWIFTITRNLAFASIKHQAKSVLVTDDDLQSYFHEHEEITSDDRLMIEALLMELQDDERQIVVLHVLSGMKHREIAGFLQKPISTVLSKYNRALKKLNALIKEE